MKNLLEMKEKIEKGFVRYLMREIVEGLLFFKKKGILHRDIKPGNIILMEDLSVKIIDFGLSREINSHKPNKLLQRRLTKHVVTRWYRPPEVILLEKYDFKLDIWSLGCVFAELIGRTDGKNLKGPLFPGRSCYPLSPIKKHIFNDELQNYVEKTILISNKPD